MCGLSGLASFWIYSEVELIVLCQRELLGGQWQSRPRSGRDKVVEPSASARHYSEHFTCIHSFKPHGNILR